MLTFSNDATPYKEPFYLVDNSLKEFGITESSTFPIMVKVGWTKVAKCSENYIRVDKLVRR